MTNCDTCDGALAIALFLATVPGSNFIVNHRAWAICTWRSHELHTHGDSAVAPQGEVENSEEAPRVLTPSEQRLCTSRTVGKSTIVWSCRWFGSSGGHQQDCKATFDR